MDPKKLLKKLVILIIFIFVLNYLAMSFHWYSSIWYFDMPMHFLGGVWVALFSLYLFTLDRNSLKDFIKILFIVFIVGVGWEFFEIAINQTITKDSFNLLDTLSDLFFDLAGGCFVILYFFKKTMSIRKNTV